jgi:hypothetical protein
MNVLSKQEKLTGFSWGEAVTTVAEGISFHLEREEAVETWAAGAVAGVEASEAAGAGLLELVLAFFDGGSMKSSSLQVCELDKMGAEYK